MSERAILMQSGATWLAEDTVRLLGLVAVVAVTVATMWRWARRDGPLAVTVLATDPGGNTGGGLALAPRSGGALLAGAAGALVLIGFCTAPALPYAVLLQALAACVGGCAAVLLCVPGLTPFQRCQRALVLPILWSGGSSALLLQYQRLGGGDLGWLPLAQTMVGSLGLSAWFLGCLHVGRRYLRP
jgi:hypothetical protein